MRVGAMPRVSLAETGDDGHTAAPPARKDLAAGAGDISRSRAPSEIWDQGQASLFESFADECDRSRAPAAVGRHLSHFVRRLGFEHVALLTHAAPDQWASLSVCAQNWGDDRADLLLPRRGSVRNPIFQGAEATEAAFHWDDAAFRARLDGHARRWLAEIEASGIGCGITQRVRGAIAPASCSLAPARREPIAVARAMRMAAYAFHHIIALQRPKLAQTDLLTQREHECLSLSTMAGLRPREVAVALGVRITTVRSMRQSASLRLGARSPEEAVWRMLETGQLFLHGRLSRPRSW